MDKCPLLNRKTSGVHYFGIKCAPIRGGIPIPTTRGVDNSVMSGWTREQRDEHYNKYCVGDYKNCKYYNS